MRQKLTGFLVSLVAVSFAVPASAQVVINEILANPGSDFDGAEFVELYNTTGAPVDISNWVLTGTEFAGACTGDHDYAFPPGTIIPANGYVVVAKDNTDLPTETDDGFLQRFGFDADFEYYDPDRTYENDDLSVPNMVLTSPQDPLNDTQIRFLPGAAFGSSCATLNQAETLRLENAIGTLIDHIEFGDGASCATDPCTGLGTSDTDQFPMFPGTGESICRDASGTDTDDCSADFFLGSNTPGAANIPNPGPALSGLTADPSSPTSAESSTISIVATDPDGIGSLTLNYQVNGGAVTTVAMSLSGVDTYAAVIPAQLDGDIVDYWVAAVDGGAPAGTSKFPDFAARSTRWGTQSIFSVQFHSPPSDAGASAELGNPVNIEGVVTTEPGLFNNGLITIQSAAGFWNGVHCFDPTLSVQVSRGDSVRVSGTVTEFFGLTEVEFFGQSNIEVISSGNTLPGPDIIGAGSLTTLNPVAETYEGVYVRVENVAVTNDSLGFGEWEISDGTGACRVDDDAFYNYVPTNGDSLDAVEGIVAYSFSNRKLEPRDNADIQGPPLATSVRYSPICPTASNTITVSSTITDNGTITRAKLVWFEEIGGVPQPADSTDLTNTSGDTWEATIGPFMDTRIVNYHIEITDDTGFDGRTPAVGDYDLYVGSVTIESVQGSYTATSDSSAVAGEPRNLAGIVTVAPGVLADNIYVIQNNWVTDPANRGIQVFSGGSVLGLISEGDSVCVSGDIVEFFGMTQVDQHFTESYVNYGFVGTLPAFELSTTDFGADSTGAVPASEVWESVLIQMSNSVVTNATVGFGQYFIDNTDPRSGQETLVDDDARFGGLTYSPTLGDSITVRGIGSFSFGQYKINPRGDFDILPYDPADAVGVNPGGFASLDFALHQNAPNPIAGPMTRIQFAVPRATDASLRVFDVSGRLVATLLDGKVDAGVHAVNWNGRNKDNRTVSSGVYFYRLQADGKEATRKMVILK